MNSWEIKPRFQSHITFEAHFPIISFTESVLAHINPKRFKPPTINLLNTKKLKRWPRKLSKCEWSMRWLGTLKQCLHALDFELKHAVVKSSSTWTKGGVRMGRGGGEEKLDCYLFLSSLAPSYLYILPKTLERNDRFSFPYPYITKFIAYTEPFFFFIQAIHRSHMLIFNRRCSNIAF